MPNEENPHAGTGSVVLDIGGDRGALIVVMPADMDGLEVEIIPTGTDARPADTVGVAGAGDDHAPHDHSHDHSHPHDHDSSQPHDHDHSHPHEGDITALPPHVAVVARPTPSGSIVHSLVYSSLVEGTYDLYIRPSGPVHLTATIVGGQVTDAIW